MTDSLLVFVAIFLQTDASRPPDKKPPSQTIDLRCGGYCLYVSLNALDLPVTSYDELENKLGQPTWAGYSMAQLEKTAKEYGAHTLGVQTSVENLLRRPGRFACIAHLDGNHFVNIFDVDDRHAQIIDPPNQYRLPLDTLRARWNGKALLVSPNPLLPEEDLPRPFLWMMFWIVIGAIVVTTAGWFSWKTVRGDS